MSTQVAPVLLRKINERRVLELIQQQGPSSRAGVTRASGMSAPTVSKAVASLIEHGLLEERGQHEPAIGRPSKLLHLASHSAGVLGVVIDSPACWVGMAGLDGKLQADRMRSFPLPDTYRKLLPMIERHARELMRSCGGTYRGVGISVPGLVNRQLDEVVFSPNLHLLDGQHPAADLSARLELPCVMFQESHALCLGERMHGEARGLDNFAMLDVSTGMGLGVMSGGQILTGNSGLAGELGHMTVEPQGQRCGCGNQGCLETVATDSAFARRLAQSIGRALDIEEALELVRSGDSDAASALEATCDYLAIAVAAVINIFNPSTLFVHGRMFGAEEQAFARLVARARQRSLRPAFADCRILQAKGSKRQGAVAGLIQHLTDAWAPSLA